MTKTDAVRLLPLVLSLAACAGQIERSPEDLTGATQGGASVAEGAGTPAAVAELSSPLKGIAVDAEWIYVIDEHESVVRVPKAGGAPETLRPREEHIRYPGGIAVDDAFVYWTTLGYTAREGRVVRMPKTGGPAVVLADKQPRPWRLAVDDTTVYWANEGIVAIGHDPTEGSVSSVPKSGGAVKVLTEQLRPLAVALDADNVYFAAGGWGGANGAVGRVPKSGGPATVLADNRVTIMSLAVDDGHVAWIESWMHARKVPTGGGPVVELQQTFPVLSMGGGVAAAGGQVYFAVGKASKEGVLRAYGPDGSPRDLMKTTAPEGAMSAFLAESMTVDASRVYWVDNTWTPTGPRSFIRSVPR